MTPLDLNRIAAAFVETSPLNRVSAEKALRPELAGMQMLEPPILGFASADDEYLLSLQDNPQANLNMDPPSFWLEGAKTVISFFLPFPEQVKRSNSLDRRQPSQEYMHARVDGQTFLIALCQHLKEALEAEGYQAVIPAADPRFWSNAATDKKGNGILFTSNWSERHAAYAAGLGTFSLNKGLITQKGMAGRFGSIITNWETTPTPRTYTELEEHCIRCGACIVACPAQAISWENGKDHARCSAYLGEILAANRPYYGCGKCQTAVPCESMAPHKPVK